MSKQVYYGMAPLVGRVSPVIQGMNYNVYLSSDPYVYVQDNRFGKKAKLVRSLCTLTLPRALEHTIKISFRDHSNVPSLAIKAQGSVRKDFEVKHYGMVVPKRLSSEPVKIIFWQCDKVDFEAKILLENSSGAALNGDSWVRGLSVLKKPHLTCSQAGQMSFDNYIPTDYAPYYPQGSVHSEVVSYMAKRRFFKDEDDAVGRNASYQIQSWCTIGDQTFAIVLLNDIFTGKSLPDMLKSQGGEIDHQTYKGLIYLGLLLGLKTDQGFAPDPHAGKLDTDGKRIPKDTLGMVTLTAVDNQESRRTYLDDVETAMDVVALQTMASEHTKMYMSGTVQENSFLQHFNTLAWRDKIYETVKLKNGDTFADYAWHYNTVADSHAIHEPFVKDIKTFDGKGIDEWPSGNVDSVIGNLVSESIASMKPAKV